MRSYINIMDHSITEGVAIKDVATLAAFCITVAEAYDAAPRHDPNVDDAWNSLKNHNENVLLKRIKGAGIKVEYTEDDPYVQYSDDPKMQIRYMLYDMVVNKRLKIYSGHSDDHPTFSPMETHVFRTVHDYFTHGKLRSVFAKNLKDVLAKLGLKRGRLPTPEQLKEIIPTISLTNRGNVGNMFTARGEFNATSTHMALAPNDATPALFTEIAGQVGYATVVGDFPQQKVAVLSGFDYKSIGRTIPGTPQARRMAELVEQLRNAKPDDVIALRIKAKPSITVKDLYDRAKAV